MAAFASSYIPTTTASATRAADSLTVTGVTGLDYPLTLFCEFERAVDTGGTEALFDLDSGSGNDEALLFVSNTDSLQILVEMGSTAQANQNVSGSISVGTQTRVALRVEADNFNAARGGTLGIVDSSGTVPATPTRILFGQRSGGSNQCYGYLRRAALWPRALTDAELQAVTT